MSYHFSATVAYGLMVKESQLWKTSKAWTGCTKHPEIDLNNQFQFEFCPCCDDALWETEQLEIDGYDEGGGYGGGSVFGYPVVHGLCDEKQQIIACDELRVDEPESFMMFYPSLPLHDPAREEAFKEKMIAAGLWNEDQFGWWICNSSG